MITWRDYQCEAIEKVFNGWQTYNRVLGVGATGMGKTQVLLGVVDRYLKNNPKARVILLSHRQELVSQPHERISQFFPHLLPKVGIVMGDHDDPHKQIVIATIQTVGGKSGKRLADLLMYGKIDLLIIDECFVAGTLVDGVPIELLRVGDEVTAWDDVTKKFVKSKITNVFKNHAPNRLIKISAGDGFIVCTENHPILCNGEWTPAIRVNIGDQIIKSEATGGKSNTNAVCGMRIGSPVQWKSWVAGCQKGARLLFGGMQKIIRGAEVFGNNVKDKFNSCEPAHEGEKSDAQRGIGSEDGRKIEGKKVSSRTWWKRKIYRSANFAINRFGLGYGSGSKDRPLPRREWLSILLQDRRWGSSIQDWDRNRRSRSQGAKGAPDGSEEDGIFEISRVDSVEVIERGRDERFTELCADGFVYNIEVENQHTYTANGIVVHNCHHAEAKQYYNLYCNLSDKNPHLKVLGVTATPERGDKKLLTRIFQHEVFNIPVRRLIDAGYLVEPIFHGIKTKVDLKSVNVSGSGGKRDYNQDQLVNAFETTDVFKLVVDTHLRNCGDRPTIIFTVSVNGAIELTKMLRAAGVKAVALYGARRKRKDGSVACDDYEETSAKERRHDALDGMKSGRYTCLVNVMIATEGFDLPKLECLHIVRPTKSDALYIQIVGRVLRLSEKTGKTHADIYDYLPLNDRNFDQRMQMYKKPKRSRASPELPPERGASNPKPKSTGETEIILLDYFNRKQEAWLDDPEGWRCIQLGKGYDHKKHRMVERGLALSPDGTELWITWRTCGDKRLGTRGDRWAEAHLLAQGDVTKNLTLIDSFVTQYGDKIIMNRAAAWRNKQPSEALKRWGMSEKVYVEGMKQGELSDAIGKKIIMGAVERAMKKVGQPKQDSLELVNY